MTSITWARPSSSLPFCAVADVRGGSVQTYCRGRWSTSDTVELYDEPQIDRRCRKCGGCLVALGLRELATAPAVDMRGAVEIDFGALEDA